MTKHIMTLLFLLLVGTAAIAQAQPPVIPDAPIQPEAPPVDIKIDAIHFKWNGDPGIIYITPYEGPMPEGKSLEKLNQLEEIYDGLGISTARQLNKVEKMLVLILFSPLMDEETARTIHETLNGSTVEDLIM